MRNALPFASYALCALAVGALSACNKSPPPTASVPTPPAPVTPAAPEPPPPPAPSSDEQLAKALDDLGATSNDRGRTVRLSSAHFKAGDTAFAPADTGRIDKLAALLKEHPESQVLIEGFSDSRGSERVNERLSAERADAVKKALVERGIDETRLRSHGVGEQRPIADNGTADGREQNRRVEIVFSNAEGRFASAGDNTPTG